MDFEEKLDEDFLFYMDYMTKATIRFKYNRQFSISEAWTHKLCGEVCTNVEEKRNRNIFLSNLVLQMEEGSLKGVFEKLPGAGKLCNATQLFGLEGPTIQEPSWMSEIVAAGGDDITASSMDARTYLATKSLPHGKGALGYIAVSLDDEPLKFKPSLDAHMEEKFAQMVPALTEMERLLINRRNPEERDRIIQFYTVVIRNVGREIDGRIPYGSNAQTQSFLDQLVAYLKANSQYEVYEKMEETMRRLELLYLLDSRLQERLVHIKTREDFLDNVEQHTLNASFFETSLQSQDIFKEAKGARANKMWEQAINSGPASKLLDQIVGLYPPFIIKKFLELLADAKEALAIKIQRRHENLTSQLKKEMRKEGEKGKRKFMETKATSDKMMEILINIKAADKKAYESEMQREQQLYGHRKEKDQVYEQIRSAMIEAHAHAVEEAEFGKYLTEQINTVSVQTRVYEQVNEESILKIEEVNMATMKNIQRLSKAVRQHEGRISTMKQLLSRQTTLDTGVQFFHL